jgi:hypothetical protein
MYAQGEQGQAAADHKLQKVTMFKRSKIILLLIFRKPFLKRNGFFVIKICLKRWVWVFISV